MANQEITTKRSWSDLVKAKYECGDTNLVMPHVLPAVTPAMQEGNFYWPLLFENSLVKKRIDASDPCSLFF